MSGFESIRISLLKDMLLIGMKRFLLPKKPKKKQQKTVRCSYVISDLNGKEIIGRFYEKELQKTNQK